MKSTDPATTPLKIERLSQAQSLRVEWADEHVCEMPYDYLRRACPCATCNRERERAEGGLRVVTEKVLEDTLQIDEISLVGAYAVRLAWSDGHTTGLYTFRFLREICPHEGGGAEAIRFESFRDIQDLIRRAGKGDDES